MNEIHHLPSTRSTSVLSSPTPANFEPTRCPDYESSGAIRVSIQYIQSRRPPMRLCGRVGENQTSCSSTYEQVTGLVPRNNTKVLQHTQMISWGSLNAMEVLVVNWESYGKKKTGQTAGSWKLIPSFFWATYIQIFMTGTRRKIKQPHAISW